MTQEIEFTDSFLSDVEKDLLQSFADSAILLNAVKKILLADVYFKGVLRTDATPDPTRNAALSLAITQPTVSNEILGQDIRALSEGVRLVESGFTRLEKFKSPGGKPTGEKRNPAR